MKKYKTGLTLDLAVQTIPFGLAFLSIFERELWLYYAIGLFLIGIWNFFGNIWHHQKKAEFKFHKFRAIFFVASLVYVALLFLIFSSFGNELKDFIDEPGYVFILGPVFQLAYFILTIRELNNLTKYSNESIEKS